MITLKPRTHDPHELHFSILSYSVYAGALTVYLLTPTTFSYGIYIKREMRTNGYAEETIRLLFDIMRQKGYVLAIARVAANNAASIALHQSLGLTLDHEEEGILCFSLSLDLPADNVPGVGEETAVQN